MPARPTQGGSSGTWGTELNAHLDVALESATGAVKTGALATGTPDGTKFLRDDRVWAAPSAGSTIGGLYNVKDVAYGATGDGVTNDTTAIQAADTAARAAGGYVYFPPGVYRCNLQLYSFSRLIGHGPVLSDSATLGVVLQAFNAALDTVKVQPGDNAYANNIALENLHILNGLHGFASYNAIAYLMLRNVQIDGATDAQFYAEGWLEEVLFDFVRLSGGDYAFRMANVTNPVVGGINYLDKATFRQFYCSGGAINGFRVEATTLNGVTFDQWNVTSNEEHGVYIDAGVTGLTINELSTEGNGRSGKKNRTTGSMTSGSPTLTLASATGWAIGDIATVKNGNGYLGDLTAEVTNLVGTTATLDANAGATVSAVATTNAEWDDLHFASTIFPTQSCTMIGGLLGGEAAQGRLRYSINADGVSNGLNLIGMHCSDYAPVYDPNRTVNVIGGNVPFRRPIVWNGSILRGIVAPSSGEGSGEGSPSLLGTQGGYDLILGLHDTVGNGSGTRGNLLVRVNDTNRNTFMRLSGTSGDLEVWGGVAPGDPGGGIVGQSLYYASAAPVAGTFSRGDIVFNTAPSAAGMAGWVCTAGGTPGTWKTWGAISA